MFVKMVYFALNFKSYELTDTFRLIYLVNEVGAFIAFDSANGLYFILSDLSTPPAEFFLDSSTLLVSHTGTFIIHYVH